MIATLSDRTNSFEGLHSLDLAAPFRNFGRNSLALSSDILYQFRLNYVEDNINLEFQVETYDPNWEAPIWLDELIQKSAGLLQLRENWNSYGAPPINRAVIDSAIELVLNISSRRTSKPSIVPTNSGGVQIEWHSNGVDLEIEIPVPGYFNVTFEDTNTGLEWEKRLQKNSLQELEDAIASLTGG